MTEKKKVLEIKASACAMCKVVYQWNTKNIIVVEIRSPSTAGYMNLSFHEDCWSIASNTLQKTFTYKEWIDLTEDEWDVFGPVRRSGYNGFFCYDQGFLMNTTEFEKKYGPQS